MDPLSATKFRRKKLEEVVGDYLRARPRVYVVSHRKIKEQAAMAPYSSVAIARAFNAIGWVSARGRGSINGTRVQLRCYAHPDFMASDPCAAEVLRAADVALE